MPVGDSIPTWKINFSQVSSLSGVDRDLSEKIYSKFIILTGKGIQANRHILLNIYKVAEITLSSFELSYNFIPDFIETVKIERKKNNLPYGTTTPIKTKNNKLLTNDENIDLGNPFIKQSQPPEKNRRNDSRTPTPDLINSKNPYKQKVEVLKNAISTKKNIIAERMEESPRQPVVRERNPITGEHGSEYNVPQPSKRRVTNPIPGVATHNIISNLDKSDHYGDGNAYGDDNTNNDYEEDLFGAQEERAAGAVARNKSGGRQKAMPRPSTPVQRPGNRPGSARSYSSNGTRPSASTLSLMHSPTSRPPTPPDRRRRPASASGLRKDKLDVLAYQKEQRDNAAKAKLSKAPPDARRVAASALMKSSDEIVKKVRDKIIERGGIHGIRSLGRLLSTMDDNGDKKLSKEELRYGLRNYGIDLTPIELEQVVIYFDRNRDGTIDFDEFLVGLRGDLSDRRKRLIRLAFDKLDADKCGEITLDEMLRAYDVSFHPDVRSGKITKAQAMKEFMAQWDRNQDGTITPEEFEEYYKDVSASIDGDDYFELMIRNAWHIAGGTGQYENTANRRVLVTRKDGSQAVMNVDEDLGLAQGDKEGLKGRLARQSGGMDVDSLDLYGGLDTTEKPKRERRERDVGGDRPPARQSREVAKAAEGGGSRRVKGNAGDLRGNKAGIAQKNSRKEAWGDAGGDLLDLGVGAADESLPEDLSELSLDDRQRKGSGRYDRKEQSGGKVKAEATVPSQDVSDKLKQLLYTPPQSLEQLAIKMQVSMVDANPRIPKAAFIQRYII